MSSVLRDERVALQGEMNIRPVKRVLAPIGKRHPAATAPIGEVEDNSVGIKDIIMGVVPSPPPPTKRNVRGRIFDLETIQEDRPLKLDSVVHERFNSVSVGRMSNEDMAVAEEDQARRDANAMKEAGTLTMLLEGTECRAGITPRKRVLNRIDNLNASRRLHRYAEMPVHIATPAARTPPAQPEPAYHELKKPRWHRLLLAICMPCITRQPEIARRSNMSPAPDLSSHAVNEQELSAKLLETAQMQQEGRESDDDN